MGRPSPPAWNCYFYRYSFVNGFVKTIFRCIPSQLTTRDEMVTEEVHSAMDLSFESSQTVVLAFPRFLCLYNDHEIIKPDILKCC